MRDLQSRQERVNVVGAVDETSDGDKVPNDVGGRLECRSVVAVCSGDRQHRRVAIEQGKVLG